MSKTAEIRGSLNWKANKKRDRKRLANLMPANIFDFSTSLLTDVNLRINQCKFIASSKLKYIIY